MDNGIGAVRFAVLIMVLLCAMATQTRAATITVTNTNDSGPGSLRQALANANDGDTINFAVTGSITLTSGGVAIDKNLTISGPGANQLSIDGNQTGGVFGTSGTTVAISGLTARNAQVGISNDSGVLTVSNCVVSENANGGLTNNSFFDTALLTIANSIVSDNSGPGISTYTSHGQSNTVIVNCTISGNSTKGRGNGISAFGFEGNVSTSVENSDISGNSAQFSGGIDCGQLGGLSIVNTTISGNKGGGVGVDALSGGIILNSTISGNLAGSAVSTGGGLRIANSTISNNSAEPAGGISNYAPGQLEISNTILNAGASGVNIVNGGTITSDGYNLSSDDGGGYLNGPGDQINTDPLLGPLRDNHGPTLTHAPLPGSPSIDAGDPSFTPPPSIDQRGLARVVNHRIDIGSVEAQPRRPSPIPRSTPPR
jgi:hypothetical protein